MNGHQFLAKQLFRQRHHVGSQLVPADIIFIGHRCDDLPQRLLSVQRLQKRMSRVVASVKVTRGERHDDCLLARSERLKTRILCQS